MISWTTVEDAIYNWIATATGISVIWGQQSDAQRPAVPYISMRAIAITPVGRDAVINEDADAPVSGAEITYKVQGNRDITLSLQCFAGAGIGSLSAMAYLDAVLSAARLPSQVDAFRAAGLGLHFLGSVQSLDAIVAGGFEPRAVLEARLYTTTEVTENATYIETVEVTNLTTGDTFDVVLT